MSSFRWSFSVKPFQGSSVCLALGQSLFLRGSSNAFSRGSCSWGSFCGGCFESEGAPVTVFDHAVTPAYRWPLDELAALTRDAGFAELGRMYREPGEGERFRRGCLLLRKP